MVCSFLEIYLDQIRDLGRAYMADRYVQQGRANNNVIPVDGHTIDNNNFGGGPIRSGGFGKRPMSATGVSSQRRPLSAAGNLNNSTLVRPSSAVGNLGNFSIMGGAGAGVCGGSVNARREAELNDLSSWAKTDLEIHETPEGNVFIKDLTLIPVKNIQEVLDVINLGVHLRETHQTSINQTSSRSHTVFLFINSRSHTV